MGGLEHRVSSFQATAPPELMLMPSPTLRVCSLILLQEAVTEVQRGRSAALEAKIEALESVLRSD